MGLICRAAAQSSRMSLSLSGGPLDLYAPIFFCRACNVPRDRDALNVVSRFQHSADERMFGNQTPPG